MSRGGALFVERNPGELDAFDVRDPSAPTWIATIGTSGSPFSPDPLALQDRYVFHVSLSQEASTHFLRIVDADRPDAMSVLGATPLSTSTEGLAVSGNLAYVGNHDDGFVVLDISDPTAPVEIGSHPFPTYALTQSGRYVYAASG